MCWLRKVDGELFELDNWRASTSSNGNKMVIKFRIREVSRCYASVSWVVGFKNYLDNRLLVTRIINEDSFHIQFKIY